MSSAAYIIIKNNDIFSALSTKNIETLAYGAVLKSYGKGDVIYRRDDEMRYVYILTKGIVKLSSDTIDDRFVIKDIIYKDNIFGENIFSKNTLRTEDAIAVKDCNVVVIKADIFKNVVMSDVPFARYLLKTLSTTATKIKQRMNLYVHSDSRARIIHFFNELRNEIGKQTAEGIQLNHGLSNYEIGLLTDTSRQTVSKVMSELKTKSVIQYEERHPDNILLLKDFE